MQSRSCSTKFMSHMYYLLHYVLNLFFQSFTVDLHGRHYDGMLVPVGQMNFIRQMSCARRSPFQILHRKRIARRRHCGGEEGERRRSVQRQRQLGVLRGGAVTRGFLCSDLCGGDGGDGGGRGAAAAQSFGEARRGGTRACLVELNCGEIAVDLQRRCSPRTA